MASIAVSPPPTSAEPTPAPSPACSDTHSPRQLLAATAAVRPFFDAAAAVAGGGEAEAQAATLPVASRVVDVADEEAAHFLECRGGGAFGGPFVDVTR